MTELFELELQGSLEYNGVIYQPGDIISVPEWLYDRLTGSYLEARQPVQAISDGGLQILVDEINRE